jgi:hypothetical protein
MLSSIAASLSSGEVTRRKTRRTTKTERRKRAHRRQGSRGCHRRATPRAGSWLHCSRGRDLRLPCAAPARLGARRERVPEPSHDYVRLLIFSGRPGRAGGSLRAQASTSSSIQIGPDRSLATGSGKSGRPVYRVAVRFVTPSRSATSASPASLIATRSTVGPRSDLIDLCCPESRLIYVY